MVINLAVHVMRPDSLVTFWYTAMASVASEGVFKKPHTRTSHEYSKTEVWQGKNVQTFVSMCSHREGTAGGSGGSESRVNR